MRDTRPYMVLLFHKKSKGSSQDIEDKIQTCEDKMRKAHDKVCKYIRKLNKYKHRHEQALREEGCQRLKQAASQWYQGYASEASGE